MKRSFSRQQKLTIVSGILAMIGIIDVLQLWLLSATMNAYLGGEESVIIPALIASAICLLLNGGLLWYVYALDRR